MITDVIIILIYILASIVVVIELLNFNFLIATVYGLIIFITNKISNI